MEPLLDKLARQMPRYKRHVTRIMTSSNGNHFYRYAAWYSLVAPLVVGSVTFLVDFCGVGRSYDFAYQNTHATHFFPIQDSVEDVAFWVCISSFAVGIASLFGIRRVGAKVILWKAGLGIIVSGFFAGIALFLLAMRFCRQ